MRSLTLICLSLVTLVIVGASLIGLSESNLWWVRMTDFPRLQYVLVLAAVIGIAIFVDLPGRASKTAILALALVALAYNGWKLGSYFSFAAAEGVACAPEDRFRVMSMNVLLGNESYDDAVAAVREAAPDILVALEIDETWSEALSPLSETLPHRVSELTGSHFGMEVRSRLPLEDVETVYPLGTDAPAILATARLPSGEAFRLIAFHPRPPHPGQHSTARDAQLMWAALQARDTPLPTVVAGDFNAVPWERGVVRMKQIGRLLDPRDGRGLFVSFDAKSYWMKWPLDQILFQPELSLIEFSVFGDIGSDHFPVAAALCHSPSQSAPPEASAADIAEAREDIAALPAEGE